MVSIWLRSNQFTWIRIIIIMVELNLFKDSEQITRYPDLHSQETFKDLWEENYKILYSEIQKNGKTNFSINQKNKSSLIKLCQNLINFFFNSSTFSHGLNLYNEKILQLSEKVSENLNLHQKWSLSLDAYIEELNLKKMENEQELESLIQNEESYCEPFPVEVFTDVGEIFQTLSKKAGFIKKKTSHIKKIEYLAKDLDQLITFKERLDESFGDKVQTSVVNLAFIQEKMKEGQEIINEISSIKTMKNYFLTPYLPAKIQNFITKIPQLNEIANNIQLNLSDFRFNYLSKTSYKDDLYTDIIELYENFEVNQTLQPLFIKDLENLDEEESKLRVQVNQYSEIWMLKHFQKNLCIIVDSINQVISYFDSLQLIKQRVFNQGITSMHFRANIPKLITLTIENYKDEFIKEHNQMLIKSCILTLHSNLCKVFKTCETLKISPNNCEINKQTFQLELIQVKTSDFIVEKNSEMYLKLFEKIKMAEMTIIQLNDSFFKVRLVLTQGVVCSGISRNVYEDSVFNPLPQRLHLRIPTNGWVEANVSTPKFLKMRNEKTLKFLNHLDFKVIRKTQLEFLDRIKTVQSKIDYGDDFMDQIKSENMRINYRVSQRFDLETLKPGELEKIYREFIIQIDALRIPVKTKYLKGLIGGIFSRLCFRKSKILKKSKKPNERNMITLAQFYENLEKQVKLFSNNPSLKFTNISKEFFCLDEIIIDALIHLAASEEIVGSFLNDFDMPQEIGLGQVDEKIQKSIFEVCRNASNLMLLQSKFTNDKEKEKKFIECEQAFERISQEFK